MLAERKPQADPSLLSGPLQLMVQGVVRFPRLTLLLGIAATIGALALTCTRLGFRTSRADLINPNSEFNQRWRQYTEEFGDKEDVVVVVEGENRQAITPVLDRLAAAIAADTHRFTAVLHRVDLNHVRAKGLHFVPLPELREIEGLLQKADPVLRGDWGQLNFASLTQWMQAGLQQTPPAQRPQAMAAMLTELRPTVEGLAAALGAATYKSPWPDMSAAAATLESLGSTYLMTDDGRLGFILLQLAPTDNEQLAQNSEAIDTLRNLIAQAKSAVPGVQIGLTGLPVIENDEMRGSQRSMTLATLLSFAGVLLVLVLAFGGLRHSVLCMAALLIGMIWACGWTTMAIGHVNLLSVAFGSVLFGLGIDYGIALLAGYVQLRPSAASSAEALVATAGCYGPSITTGAATSAIAFFMVGLTEFVGVAQLGVIAGVGILLCWLATMTVLPAMIELSDCARPTHLLPHPLDLRAYLNPLLARPRLMVVGTIVVTAALALGLRHLWYDYNLLNMQADGLESVQLEKKLMHETNLSASFALSVADSPSELLARKEQFLALPTVDRVEEIASLFPGDEAQKQPIIARIRPRLAHLPAAPPQIAVVPQAQLDQLLAGAEQMLAMAPEAQAFAGQLQQLRTLVRRMPPQEYQNRMTAYQQALAGDLLRQLRLLQSVSDPQLPTLADLPSGLTTRFVGKTGKFVQKIYARVNVWDMAGMEQFVREVRSVDKNATGNPMQIYEASRQMKQSYEHAAWYTLFGILPVVLIDFRRLSHGLLAAVPLALGMVQMFGLMGALDMPLNPANMIVLPFLLGIGLENGVHLVHSFRRQGARFRGMDNSAALAVLVNSLTTMVGFASLMIATHQGLQSLGRVLTIGMSCCLLSALLMPNLLILLNRYLWGAETDEPAADAADNAAGDTASSDDQSATAPAPAYDSYVDEAPASARWAA